MEHLTVTMIDVQTTRSIEELEREIKSALESKGIAVRQVRSMVIQAINPES